MRHPVPSLRRIAKGKDPRAAFYAALAYFLWSIVPHFHLLIHSHAGGTHAHAELSGSQVRLANRVLDGLGPLALAASADGDAGGQASPEGGAGPSADRTPGASALAVGADAGLHAHFWEDANLASAVPLPGFALAAAALAVSLLARYAPPALGPAGAAPARGPPSLLFA